MSLGTHSHTAVVLGVHWIVYGITIIVAISRVEVVGVLHRLCGVLSKEQLILSSSRGRIQSATKYLI